MARIPNREDDLARPRSRKGKEHDQPITKGTIGSVTIPEGDPGWCRAACMVWEAAQESGVSDYYASTDWATLYVACDQLTHLYGQEGRRSPEFYRVISQTLGSLLFTEGDRRKVRVELERPDESSGELAEVIRGMFSAAE